MQAIECTIRAGEGTITADEVAISYIKLFNAGSSFT